MKTRLEYGSYLHMLPADSTAVGIVTRELLRAFGETVEEAVDNLRARRGIPCHPTRCPIALHLRGKGITGVFVGPKSVEVQTRVRYGSTPIEGGKVNPYTGNRLHERHEHRISIPLPSHIIEALAVIDGRAA